MNIQLKQTVTTLLFVTLIAASGFIVISPLKSAASGTLTEQTYLTADNPDTKTI